MKRQFGLMSLFTFVLLLLVACAERTTSSSQGSNSDATSTSGPVLVQVKATEFKIESSMTRFSSGTTYRFTVTNDGKVDHEFMIMPKSEGSMNGMSMKDMDGTALAMIDDIRPGETKTLDYKFPTSANGSHPELACYLPGHYEAGMKLAVTIGS